MRCQGEQTILGCRPVLSQNVAKLIVHTNKVNMKTANTTQEKLGKQKTVFQLAKNQSYTRPASVVKAESLEMFRETKRLLRASDGTCQVSLTSYRLNMTCEADSCPSRQTFVTDCQNGSREIVVLEHVAQSSVSCVPVVKRTVKMCRSCCPSINQMVTMCNQGKRRLIRVFWEEVNKCCVKRKLVDVLPCKESCPADSVVQTTCLYGQRLRYRIYYVGEACSQLVAAEALPCDPAN
ncbi:unnamed protein product [Protopolystoma xenopodis]|uniref:Uncharacterized protein n=1 Tax=Protopolystoma xenopodis TaxID=117903 RepID=A0A448X638_9PLAT|nr:unnamed protein product [Protopolystoma xenopodis]